MSDEEQPYVPPRDMAPLVEELIKPIDEVLRAKKLVGSVAYALVVAQTSDANDLEVGANIHGAAVAVLLTLGVAYLGGNSVPVPKETGH